MKEFGVYAGDDAVVFFAELHKHAHLFSKRYQRTIQETTNRSHYYLAEEFLYRGD